jgi:hypothetical protein
MGALAGGRNLLAPGQFGDIIGARLAPFYEMFHLLPRNIGAGELAILCLLTQRFGTEFRTIC